MTRAIIAGIENQQKNFSYLMKELAQLAEANGMETVADFSQKIDKPIAATYLGKGKIEEIAKAAQHYDAQYLILNDELSPTQIRNLEKETALSVLDRTELILEIFSNRAHTKEAQLQVEIARLKYQLPRLRSSSAISMDQQSAGSSAANRGAGETKLELNRRTIQHRIAFLNRELKAIEKEYDVKSKSRRESEVPRVALVGYTNAGKSTTLNGLISLLGGEEKQMVFEKDMLFATLDTSVRKLTFSDNKTFLLSDTVGFVNKLPHTLIEAFKSTLAEVREADLLIQVVDISDESSKEMIETTNRTLEEIGAANKPMIYAYNKADKAGIDFPSIEGLQITYSAKEKSSLQQLAGLIKGFLFKGYKTYTYLIPYTQGSYLEKLNVHANVLATDYTPDGSKVTAEVSPRQAGYYAKFLVKS
ncbi:GTPase HflX [Liquorilactobacillus oeni]|uniref:GTPase HflX n=1 Tax=Liquorilactobacillus oeni DSM 19972 TaxID=1423777 RepID=A0A0R1MBP4_9LACO|nr:GTPase HflX [Liquorilactobacillus oeni]KRL05655.1 GTP-binding protein [Liquorilactobacillus oeni DSM 19972]